MTNYYDRDDYGDNNGNKDVTDENNAASRLGSDGLIFDLITMPQSHGGGSGDGGDGAAAAAHFIYIYPF